MHPDDIDYSQYRGEDFDMPIPGHDDLYDDKEEAEFWREYLSEDD